MPRNLLRTQLVASCVCVLLVGLTSSASAQTDPNALLKEADRLAWLRAWGAAESRYADAERLFSAQGDTRNALYAQVSVLRGQLPRLPAADVSVRLAEYLEHPLVQSDDELRLRCLVIKGETDEDLDPSLAAESWREAEAVATKLGNAPWANRARGELGMLAFVQGDIGASVIGLGQALKVAQSNGDVSSQVRWLTLFGLGYVQLGRPQEALDFYERALKVASTVPELQFPLMTHVGRSDALIKLNRVDEADQILTAASQVAAKLEARGYQAQLLMQRALLANGRQQPDRALALLAEATGLARAAGGNRILAEIALDASTIQRERKQFAIAERTLRDGVQVARTMQDRLLLPRLLAQLADLRASQGHVTEASALLLEASDILEGFFTTTSSPWVQSRLISGMDAVFLSRIRLEATPGRDLSGLFAAIEQARGRSLLELLVNRPLSGLRKSDEMRAGERQIATLQRRLLGTADRRARARLMEQIFAAEEQLAPASTALFDRARRPGGRTAVALRDLQRALNPDEVLLEFALLDPASYVVVATRTSARLQRLPGRTVIAAQVERLLKSVRAGQDDVKDAAALATMLIGTVPELATRRRLIVSPDGELHQLPFELLPTSADGRLLESHVVSYVPSGSVLTVLRRNGARAVPITRVLAVSASPTGVGGKPPAGPATRSVLDLDPTRLRPLPSADDEARSVEHAFGSAETTLLVGDAATETELKRQPLAEFQALHFAVHGIPSTKFPARAALLLHPGAADDGLLEAREILMLRLRAELVTLSACDTGSGSVHGQEGAASLVRPFLAAGARSVVASLWAMDDTFSLALMREFYRRLAAGADVGEALRDAKVQMLKSFGPQAVPRLWSGVLIYGDGRGNLSRAEATAAGRN